MSPDADGKSKDFKPVSYAHQHVQNVSSRSWANTLSIVFATERWEH